MSDSIGAMAGAQGAGAAMAQQASSASSGFSSQISDAIKSSVSPKTGKLDVHEATDKLHMLSATSHNPAEKAACESAVNQIQSSATGMSNQPFDSKTADKIAGTAMGGSSAMSPNMGGGNFGDALQVTLNSNASAQGAGGVQFSSHLFVPQPVDNSQKASDRPSSNF